MREQIEKIRERLVRKAEQARERAKVLPPGCERDALLKKASQADTLAHIEEWLFSPGLRPPN
jgi:hypothetical protein